MSLSSYQRLELILTYYILWKMKREPRILKQYVRHYITNRVKRFEAGDLSIASIADLGTKDHDLLDARDLDANHLQYLLIDGTRAMTGNLDMGANHVDTDKIVGASAILKDMGGNFWGVRNTADTAFRYWVCHQLSCYQIKPYSGAFADSRLYTWSTATAYWEMFSHNGAAYVSCIKLINGTVRMANLPAADPADGTSTLWMDANRFVKVGT